MNDPHRPVGGNEPARDPHATHDELLIAALAADDLQGAERTGAERLVASCSDCRLLYGDIRAIASATAVMPAMPRRRDFRLSAEDAARLRPTSWRRFAAALAGTRFAVTRPLAVGLSTLGIVGLLISAMPGQGGFFGSTASAPEVNSQDRTTLGAKGVHADASGLFVAGGPQAASTPGEATMALGAPSSAATTAATDAAASMPAVAPSAPAASMIPEPAGGGSSGSSGGDNTVSGVDTSPGPPVGVVGGGSYGANGAGALPPDAAGSGKVVPGVPEVSPAAGAGSTPSPLAVISVLCLVAGIGLFAVRTAAKRATPG